MERNSVGDWMVCVLAWLKNGKSPSSVNQQILTNGSMSTFTTQRSGQMIWAVQTSLEECVFLFFLLIFQTQYSQSGRYRVASQCQDQILHRFIATASRKLCSCPPGFFKVHFSWTRMKLSSQWHLCCFHLTCLSV